MNDWWQLLIVLLIAANPAGAAAGMALVRQRVDFAGYRVPLAGAALAVVGLLFVAAVILADPLLDVLSVEHPTFQIGAGVVLLVVGIQTIWRGHARFREPGPGWQAGIYPLGLPLAGNPALLAAALAWSADPDAGGWLTLAMGVPAIVVAVGVAVMAPAGYERYLAGASRLLGVLLILVAVALGVSGVQSV